MTNKQQRQWIKTISKHDDVYLVARIKDLENLEGKVLSNNLSGILGLYRKEYNKRLLKTVTKTIKELKNRTYE